jgi:hypothetical protein
MGHGPSASHENPAADVARASRRAASTVVSTFCSAVTAISLEIQSVTPTFDGAVSRRNFHPTLTPGATTPSRTRAGIPPASFRTKLTFCSTI